MWGWLKVGMQISSALHHLRSSKQHGFLVGGRWSPLKWLMCPRPWGFDTRSLWKTMSIMCHTISYRDSFSSAEVRAQCYELRAWVMLNVRLWDSVQWATLCVGGLRWYARRLCSEFSCRDPVGFVSFCLAFEVLLYVYSVPNLQGLGASHLGTEVHNL